MILKGFSSGKREVKAAARDEGYWISQVRKHKEGIKLVQRQCQRSNSGSLIQSPFYRVYKISDCEKDNKHE
jgi:hypothetical protein